MVTFMTECEAMVSTLDKAYSDGTPVSVEDNAICLYRFRKR